jgi:hypothetical protein
MFYSTSNWYSNTLFCIQEMKVEHNFFLSFDLYPTSIHIFLTQLQPSSFASNIPIFLKPHIERYNEKIIKWQGIKEWGNEPKR